MRERPILMCDDMARATFVRLKSETRRLRGLEDVNRYPGELEGECSLGALGYRGLLPSAYYLAKKCGPDYKRNPGAYHWFLGRQRGEINPIPVKCPYGQVGDRLWVREAWLDDGSTHGNIHYRASATEEDLKWLADRGLKWRPSIHMPRKESRILLEILEIRAERLADITLEGVLAEGIRIPVTSDGQLAVRLTGPYPTRDYIETWPPSRGDVMYAEYFSLWDTLNAARGFPVKSNPWCWVVCYKMLEQRAQ